MNIKIGDKVRFLNSVGGGVVRSFRGKDQVIVEGDDGFEIPALMRELVVVEHLDSQKHTNLLSQGNKEQGARSKEQREKGEQGDADSPLLGRGAGGEAEAEALETPEGERLNIFLAYLPLDLKTLQQSRYECYFVNESNYYLFFNYMSRHNNSWISRYNGLIEPNTKIFIEEFGKEDLNDLERICVQFVAFKKGKPYALKNAVSVELHVDTVKFYKMHCFMENDFFNEDALVFPVVRDDVPEREQLISATDLQEAMQQKTRIDRPVPPKPHHHKKAPEPIVEVDLHISQLLDNTNGMSPADMLEYQLGKFRETLTQYANNKGQKIVFIHGKGDGVLRNAIEKELRTKYKNYFYQDASFREYGFGATMVTIK